MQCVMQFHRAFGLPAAARPHEAKVSKALAELRIDLLVEEVQEFADAARRGDLVALADALADITYVTYGAALTYGIDLDAVLREIHRANMSKLGPDGRPVLRNDGKVLKPVTYRPPNVKAVLAVQLPLPFDDTW
ncbi:nucleotide pyrophosphohydrolase [Mycolicibacterium setense]|nr:nucleotide pyrophosphohydrolase [Mycolicibacterium setense]